MPVLENFVNLNFDKGKNMLMFGLPIKDFNKPELIACVGWLSEKLENNRNDYINSLDNLSSLRKKENNKCL